MSFEDAGAQLESLNDADPDIAAALLMRVVRRAALEAAGRPVEPISVTIDVAGRLKAEAALSFSAKIDRKTRTIVFAGGVAQYGEEIVMSATAVYRIPPEA